VAALTAHRIPFSEVSAHRATLEDAYLQLTKDAVEFSAARATTSAAPGDLAVDLGETAR
jgi:ABC-2 type transport system ATP-binding protein